MKASYLIRGALLCLPMLVMASVLSAPARADIIRWNLNNFTFQDGGVANGFFDWDNVTLTSPNYDIAVSGGNTVVFPPVSYTDETTDFGTATNNTLLFFDTNVPSRSFRIGVTSLTAFNTPVSVLDLAPTASAGPTGYVECFNCTPQRLGDFAAEAFLSVNPVPEPVSAGLLLMGLLGILGFARQRA